MLTHSLPLLATMQNLTFCLEATLDKVPYETVALVHLNATVDMADSVYGLLRKDRHFAWMKFNMDNHSTPENNLLKDNLIGNIFFLYFLDDLTDCLKIFTFIRPTLLNYRDNQIYVVDNYAGADHFKEMSDYLYMRGFYASAILFWNTSGEGFGLKAYTFHGYKYGFDEIPFVDGQCGMDIYDKMFFHKMMNFYGTPMIVFGQTDPPKILKTVASVNGKHEYSIGGHDVLITDAILKHLNARPVFKVTDMILHTLNVSEYAVNIKPQNNTEQRTFNVSQIYRYDWSAYEDVNSYRKMYGTFGFELNSQQMRYSHYMETLQARTYTYLYPHDTDNSIIIVPRRYTSKTEYDQMLKSPLILVWAPAAVIVVTVRFVFNKIRKTDKNLIDISLQTFGLSLGMSFHVAISSAAENLLLWWFCLGTMLSGMLLSSSMFQGFALQLEILTINNLKELEMSGLEIRVPMHSESVEHFFDNIPQKLKLNFMMAYEISDMIQNRNTSCAYVIQESKFNFMFSNDKDVWHVIYRFGHEHLSYKLRLFSAIENHMNILVQRCVNHGIVKYLVEKNKRLLTGIKPTKHKDKDVISSNVKPVSFNDMRNSFLLGALGLVLSTITFVAEKIHFAICCYKRKSKAKFKI